MNYPEKVRNVLTLSYGWDRDFADALVREYADRIAAEEQAGTKPARVADAIDLEETR